MRDLNQCNFIGRIGKDPEAKYMPNGDAVVNFSIACNDDYKKDGAKVEKTNWINIVAFRQLGELVDKYCNKGSKVFVSGKQQTRKWQAQDGTDRYSTEIVAMDVQFLDSKGDTTAAPSYSQQSSNAIPSGQAPIARNKPQANPVDDGFDDDVTF